MSSLSSSSEDSDEEYDKDYPGFERQHNLVSMKRPRSSSSSNDHEDKSPMKKRKGKVFEFNINFFLSVQLVHGLVSICLIVVRPGFDSLAVLAQNILKVGIHNFLA